MGHWKKIDVRGLPLHTSAILNEVGDGQVFVIEKQAIPWPNCGLLSRPPRPGAFATLVYGHAPAYSRQRKDVRGRQVVRLYFDTAHVVKCYLNEEARRSCLCGATEGLLVWRLLSTHHTSFSRTTVDCQDSPL